MNIDYLIQLLNNKLVALNNAKTQAVLIGDIDTVTSIDNDILGVQTTLSQLNVAQQIANAAAAANTTTDVVVANAVASTQQSSSSLTVPTNPTSVLSLYDLSTYAADPLYLQKITDILQVMPSLDTSQEIDAYINSEAIGSPLSGQMILAAAQQYSVDTRLLCSILELESNFGTAGLAVSTINPGNVGNTGTSTRTYNSWQDGVAAVAKWLSVHPAAGLSLPKLDSTINNSIASSTATTSTSTMDPTAFTDQSTTTSNTITPTMAATTVATTTAAVTGSNSTTTDTIYTPPTSASSTNALASSTPVIVATSTDATSIDATASSTNTISTSTPITASSTPDTVATSTTATSTTSVNILNTSSTPTLDSSTSTTTPLTNASSTAMRIVPIRRRRV